VVGVDKIVAGVNSRRARGTTLGLGAVAGTMEPVGAFVVAVNPESERRIDAALDRCDRARRLTGFYGRIEHALGTGNRPQNGTP